jgi:hypothetical protein
VLKHPTTLTLEGAISMIIYYLMIKTHTKTGLKYLCQTKRKDPFKYTGSGLYWGAHLNKHGTDITTVILQKCYSKTSLKSWGLFYSKLWDVVKSKQWANLKPEEGQGGWGGAQNPNNNPELKKIKSERLKKDNPVFMPGVAKKISNTLTGRPKSACACKSMSIARAKRVAEKAPNFDNTVYKFIHKDGTIEISTQCELRKKHGFSSSSICALISGKAKTCHGWKLSPWD